MKQLLNVIDYFKCGNEKFPTQSYFDDKQMPEAEKERLKGKTYVELNINNIANELALALERCEKERRSLCFYMNGARNRKDIVKIRFHFVDIDEEGGTKEEQFARIMSAPLQPTLIYRGRAGHKLLYAVVEAVWDTSTDEKLEQSVIKFKNVQQQLIEFFKGDPKRCSPNDCFRLPCTINYKEYTENGKVYKEEIILWERSNVYTQDQLSNAFPVSQKRFEVKDSLTFDSESQDVQDACKLFIEHLDSEGLLAVVKDDKVSFKCPIHNDSSPSAFLFYNKLVCHCSSANGGNKCEIGDGKSLRWVAKAKGWTDLEALCKKIDDKIAEEYEDISLDDMQSTELVPLQQIEAVATDHVKAVLDEVVSTMKSRGIVVDDITTKIHANIIHELNLQAEGITVCPLEPGGGKSTIMATYLKYMLDQALPESGTIIVVERVETAKRLLEEFGPYTVFIDADGKAIDVEHYKPHPASFVMESAYTYKKCKLKPKKYQYGVCRTCPFKEGCKLSQKHQEQGNYPILIITQARLKMEAGRLGKFKKWKCIDGNECERKRIIIDEKPPIVEVTTLQNTHLDQFLYDVRTMSLDIKMEEMAETKMLIGQLREQLLEATNGEKLLPINPDFVFPYSKTWYKKYSGDNVNLLKDIEYVIQKGGRVNHDRLRNVISVVTNRTVQYDFSGYHVAILDGTAKFDMEYGALQRHQMLDIPPVKTFEHLTFFVDSSISSSKGKFTKDTGLLADIARNISIISTKETVLALCFKGHVEMLKNLLSREIKEGRVLINHFGNIKGSNEYSHCTALVLVGTVHKSDPFYINKHEAICGEVEDIKVLKRKDIRRFNDLDIEMIKLNDQIVDTIQDILRICIRNNGATAQAKVYMMTKDVAFVNILQHYFDGCNVVDWNMSGTYPEWYMKLDEYFGALKQGDVIEKAELRNVLDLEGEAGKKELQRHAKKKLYTKLLSEHSIAIVNNRKYKKVDRLEVEHDQAIT